MTTKSIITLTIKWTAIIMIYALLFFVAFPIMISATSDIIPLIGMFLIPVSIVILGILIYKQIKSLTNKLN